jgi:hypothetical protein
MDPVTVGALARIRQQEFIDEAALDRQGELVGIGRAVNTVVRLVRTSIGKVFSPSSRTQERAEQPHVIATSR